MADETPTSIAQNATNDGAHRDDTDFEEERKILLQSMSEKLQQVLERMARANTNLEQLADQGRPVQDVASLWRAAFQKQQRPGTSDAATAGDTNNNDHESSGLHDSSRSSLSAPGLG